MSASDDPADMDPVDVLLGDAPACDICTHQMAFKRRHLIDHDNAFEDVWCCWSCDRYFLVYHCWQESQ